MKNGEKNSKSPTFGFPGIGKKISKISGMFYKRAYTEK